MNTVKIKKYAKDLAHDIAGCILLAVAVKCFSAPNNIAPGGVTGIATMINYVTGSPLGIVNFILNIPLLIIAYKKLGKKFTLRTTMTIAIFTIAFDFIIVTPPIPVYRGDAMLAALFGGILTGIGASLIFMRGSTAGGTDIVTKLIQKKYPYISIGQIVLGINGVIIMAAAAVYQSIEAALYGLIMTFTIGRVIDAVLYGADTGKSLTIVTRKPDEMSQAIIKGINRSATILHGKGAYKQDDMWVLMCVVRKQEFHPLKNLIREVDSHAFIIVNEAHEIIGTGFKAIDQENT